MVQRQHWAIRAGNQQQQPQEEVSGFILEPTREGFNQTQFGCTATVWCARRQRVRAGQHLHHFLQLRPLKVNAKQAACFPWLLGPAANQQ